MADEITRLRSENDRLVRELEAVTADRNQLAAASLRKIAAVRDSRRLYRLTRKEMGLCWVHGCKKKADGYCEEHREDNRYRVSKSRAAARAEAPRG